MQAGEYLSRAIELEPDYAAAHAWYAYWQMFLVGQGWADDPAAAMEEAGQHAERAVVLDPFDARGLTIAGHVRAFLHRRLREAIALHERALSLNPNLAMAWALSAHRLRLSWAIRTRRSGATTATRSCRRSIRTHSSSTRSSS